ncbi:MAG: hypothetical protein Q9187_007567 [Circinaria calcarea]
MLQSPQSCLSPTADASGKNSLTIVAAVRNTLSAPSVNLVLTLKVPRSGIIVPALQTASVAMTQQSTVGPYNLYVATYALDPAQGQTTKFEVSIGSGSSRVVDGFKNTRDLPVLVKPILIANTVDAVDIFHEVKLTGTTDQIDQTSNIVQGSLKKQYQQIDYVAG